MAAEAIHLTRDLFQQLDYYKNYRLAKDEIDLSSYLLDEDVEGRIASCAYPTLPMLSQLQRTKGQAPRDPRAKSVAPFPPRRRKEELFREESYAEKDAYVKSQVPQPFESEQSFAARLFKKSSSNLDKVRAAFYFVCTAEVEQLAPMQGESNIYNVIRLMRSENTVEYVFERLLGLADVPVQRINGTKKGVSYENGISPGRRVGSWFACYVEGEWRFIDAYWGSTSVSDFDTGNYALLDESGNVASAEKREGHTVYACDEAYFLTDPDKLILTHFPDDEQRQWQLLARPLTFDEFQRMPRFFESYRDSIDKFQLVPQSHPLNVIIAPPGTLRIFLKELTAEKYEYSTTISIHKDSLTEEARAAIREQRNVKRFLSKGTRTERKDEVKFKLVPPCSGKFLLVIQVTKGTQGRTYSADFITYVIHCPQADQNAQELPEGSELLQYFGPGPALISAGLTTEEAGELRANNGERQLIFESLTFQYRLDMLSCVLMDASNQTLPANNVLIWLTGRRICILFLSPDSGSFALVVQQRETPVCQFLVNSPSWYRDARHFPIPDLERLGGLGFPDSELNELIHPDSHPDPCVTCEEASLELQFALKIHIDIEVELIFIDSEGQDSLSDGFAFVNGTQRGFCVDVRFRLAGHYVVRLKARRERSDEWKHYGNYFVRSLGQLDGLAERFPDRLDPWSCDHRLVQPMQKLLPLNVTVTFRLKIENVTVAYLVNEAKNERSLMQKSKNGLWEGSVKAHRESAGKPLKVIAGNNKNDCEELLGYQFESKGDHNIRNQSAQEAEELNQRRARSERLRQRKQENYQRAEQAQELLPEDPEAEERERIRLQQEAEQRRLEQEKRRKEEEEKRRREEEEERKKLEIEKRRREDRKRREEEEARRREEEEAERQREEERRRDIEEKQRRREEQQKRQREASEAKRLGTREEIRRSLEAAEARRKAEKRERRRAKEKRREEQTAVVRKTKKAEKQKERLRNKLALSLYRDPDCKSLQLDELVKKMQEGDCNSDDEALLLLSVRKKEAAEYKRDLENEMLSARKSKNPSALKALVNEIENKSFSKVVMSTSRIEPEVSKAKELIKSQERQVTSSQFRQQQQPPPELNRHSLVEISSLNNPNSNLHTVVQASLLLLGHCELETQSWKRARMIPKTSFDQLKSLKASEVEPAIAARAKQLLDSLSNKPMGIEAALRAWASDVCSAVLSETGSKCQPAVGKQQLKLLGVSPGQVEDWKLEEQAKIF